MTMRYAHVGDREIEAAAERVGQVIASMTVRQAPAVVDAAATSDAS